MALFCRGLSTLLLPHQVHLQHRDEEEREDVNGQGLHGTLTGSMSARIDLRMVQGTDTRADASPSYHMKLEPELLLLLLIFRTPFTRSQDF